MPSQAAIPHRNQRTISRPVELSGIGFFTGADVRLQFLPAAENHGIAFQRIDCDGAEPIPALVENVVPRSRRTTIGSAGVSVEMIEHAMAALAGLHIDNCLVQLDAPELPGFDGSCREMADALIEADIVEQNATRGLLRISDLLSATGNGGGEILAKPVPPAALAVGYHLDYGPQSPIHAQNLTVIVTPESFMRELASCRTFVLMREVEALRAQGYGRRVGPQDLLVFDNEGVIDNELHFIDECARHKILDCVGDLALLGCDLHGHIDACCSGHRLNHEIVRRLISAYADSFESQERIAA